MYYIQVWRSVAKEAHMHNCNVNIWAVCMLQPSLFLPASLLSAVKWRDGSFSFHHVALMRISMSVIALLLLYSACFFLHFFWAYQITTSSWNKPFRIIHKPVSVLLCSSPAVWFSGGRIWPISVAQAELWAADSPSVVCQLQIDVHI